MRESGLHVRSQGCQSKRERHEERSGPVVPSVDEREWIPQNIAIKGCAGGCDGNADEADERKCGWNDCELDVLPGQEGRRRKSKSA